jgi:N-acetylglucosaminyldiphosphoundecaprenol N-acetyl-beta-D-mannosaminyltransferase
MISIELHEKTLVSATFPDALSRQVYCVLGIPIDAVEMPVVLNRIETAAARSAPFAISTPNLNFLVSSQSDPDFRETLLQSDLCPADGMPILWIAWLIGVPIKSRIAGSDIFDALKHQRKPANPLKVFLFVGAEGAAAAASRALNDHPNGIRCVGSLNPGFGSVDEMSRRDIIDRVNASGADFLVASLGAKKGQLWLQRNFHRFVVPIRAHLGAVLNFQAGTVRRAPPIIRKCGLEWLWRIKEEPHLWRRYWNDGVALLRLILTRVLPLAIWSWWLLRTSKGQHCGLAVTKEYGGGSITVRLSGFATAQHVNRAIPIFRDAIRARKQVIVDLSGVCAIDARFLGLLLMLRKGLGSRGGDLLFVGLSRRLIRIFRLSSLGFLLSGCSAPVPAVRNVGLPSIGDMITLSAGSAPGRPRPS